MSNNYEYAYDEPFGWYDGIGFSTNKNDFGEAITSAIPLYTHPAPAWQGFNEEEFIYFTSFVTADVLSEIEKTLREKNHG